ncbi:MAG: hypothetical protein J5496_02690 [Lachnospiraceae bacterium]|nr:hypothetical protein [Lachnospiraceae bacterium]
MKKILKGFWNYIDGVYGLLLSLYASLAFGSQAVLIYDSFADIARGIVLSIFFSFLFCPLLLKKLRTLELKAPGEAGRKDRLLRWLFFLIPLAVMLIAFAAFYPGGFATDPVNQYGQAVSSQYGDWHPVIHTLLAYKLPLLLTGGWTGSVVLFQILWLSAAVGTVLCVILKYAGRKIAVFSLLLFVLNPQLSFMAMFPFKDMSFAACTLLLTAFSLEICFTKGEWLRKTPRLIAFILLLALATLLRHNGILFTLPLLFAVFWFVGKKRTLIVGLGVLLLMGLVKLPLQKLLNVQKADQRQVEMLGVPMSVIGAVAANRPDALDEETREFAFKVAPQEVWERGYIDGFNYVKWAPETDNDVIEEYGAVSVVKMMLKSIKASPVTALKGLIRVTCPVYSPFYYYHFKDVWVTDNAYGLTQTGLPALRNLEYQYSQLAGIVAPHLFYCLGAMHLLILAAVLAKCRFRKKEDLKKLCLALPLLIYNFGTALLMTGAEDACRFFFYTYFVTPLLLILFFRKDAQESPIAKGDA